MKSRAVVLAVWAACLLDSAVASEGVLDHEVASERLTVIEREATYLTDRVRFLVEQHGRDVDLTIGEFERRFSEAEIHFLLENYTAAIVYLYDIVDTPRFRHLARYDDALFYLAESLYQQESWLPARGFFLELMERAPTRHDDNALLRLLEISGRVGDYGDVEEHYRRLVASGRPLRPEVRYVWGKFLFARADLDDHTRWMRAVEAFSNVPIDGPHGLAARYYTGVVHVQEGRKTHERDQRQHQANQEALREARRRFHATLERAERAFLDVVSVPAPDMRRQRVQEQAWLALGRLYLEMGRSAQAIDAYQRIHRHSAHYWQSLYEVAWAFVKSGDLDNARRAAEILLTGASDSTLAPEIRLLLGHLHARAKRYDRAISSYEEVIVEYSPIRDELDALLDLHDDPIAHFSEVIGSSEGVFDVETLLPAAAAGWASTQQDVERGLAIVADLEAGRGGLGEGREIASRILASLDGGTLEPFPALAEGHRLSKEAQSRLLQLQGELGELEHSLISHRVPPNLKAEYDDAIRERQHAEDRFRRLPATPEQLEARRQEWLTMVDRISREAFRARLDAQSQAAQVVAMRRLLRDRRDEISAAPGVMDAFLARLDREMAEVERLEARSNALIGELERLSDAVRADTAVAGAREAVAEYGSALERERELMSRVRSAVGTTDAVLARLDRARQGLVGSADSMALLLDDIERRGAVRRQVLRDQVMTELARLDEYAGGVTEVGLLTRDLVGRIAHDSVLAVRQEFYDLILRSDVGIIDVAWARKSDRSREIQVLVEDKDRQLRALQSDFREALHDPDAESRR